MRRLRHLPGCLSLIVALALTGPAAALATSAGDQQYVDPLAQSHGSTSKSSSSRNASSTSSSSGQASGSSGAGTLSASSGTSPAASGATSGASTTAASATSKLPRTGFSADQAALLGLALLCVGLGARLVLRGTRLRARRTTI